MQENRASLPAAVPKAFGSSLLRCQRPGELLPASVKVVVKAKGEEHSEDLERKEGGGTGQLCQSSALAQNEAEGPLCSAPGAARHQCPARGCPVLRRGNC